MHIHVKKNKSRKWGRTWQVRGGHAERTVVLNSVVRKGLTDKVTWFRNVKAWVPDNYNFNIPLSQTIWAAELGEYRSTVSVSFITHMK